MLIHGGEQLKLCVVLLSLTLPLPPVSAEKVSPKGRLCPHTPCWVSQGWMPHSDYFSELYFCQTLLKGEVMSSLGYIEVHFMLVIKAMDSQCSSAVNTRQRAANPVW